MAIRKLRLNAKPIRRSGEGAGLICLNGYCETNSRCADLSNSVPRDVPLGLATGHPHFSRTLYLPVTVRPVHRVSTPVEAVRCRPDCGKRGMRVSPDNSSTRTSSLHSTEHMLRPKGSLRAQLILLLLLLESSRECVLLLATRVLMPVDSGAVTCRTPDGRLAHPVKAHHAVYRSGSRAADDDVHGVRCQDPISAWPGKGRCQLPG